MAGYSLTVPTQDTNGYTVIPALKTGRAVYVSWTKGNDSNSGLTPLLPKKTIAAGVALLRNNVGDRLYLRCGDTWSAALGGITTSGASRTDPLVITSYGNGPRPLLKTGISNGVNLISLSHVWIMGIEFYCDTRDPDSATYDAAVVDPNGIYSTTNCTDIQIEDCKASFYVMNFSIDPPTRTNDLRIRKNAILNGYQVTGSSQGDLGHNVFIAKITDLLFDCNVLDHGGWNDTVAGAGYYDQRHNCYTRSIINGTYSKNLFSRGSNLGLSITSTIIGGEVASDNNLITGNLFVQNGNDIAFGADAAGVNNNVTVIGNVFTETGHTISGVDQSNGIGINYANGMTITGNLFVNKANLGYGAYLSIAAHPQVGITFTGNTTYSNWIGTDLPTSNLATSQVNCTYTPNDLRLASNSYIAPTRTLGGYSAAWNGAGTATDFALKCAAQRKGAADYVWNPSLAISWLTIGFIKTSTAMPSIAINGTNTISHSFTTTTLTSKVAGSGFLSGTVPTLGTPTNYILTSDNPTPLAPGGLLNAVLYPWGSTGVVIVQTYLNCTAIVECYVSGEDLIWRSYVKNPSGAQIINVGLWSMPNLVLGAPGVTDGHQEPSTWWIPAGAGGTVGGLAFFSPANETSITQFRGTYLVDGNGKRGVGFCQRVSRESKNATVLGSNTSGLNRTVTWLEYLNCGAGATKGALMTVRLSANTDPHHLMQPYKDQHNAALGLTYNPDQRVNMYSTCADTGGAGTYSYLRRIDTGDGGLPAYAATISGIVGQGSGFMLFNAAGMDPAYPHLIDPNFIELLQSASMSPQSGNIAGVIAGIRSAGLIPMIASRPGDKRNSNPAMTPVRNDYTTTTDTDAQVTRHVAAVTMGFGGFYMDSTAQGADDRIPIYAIRQAVGPEIPFYAEFVHDGILPDSGIYGQLNWDGANYTISNSKLTPYALSKFRWLQPQCSLTAIRSTNTLQGDFTYCAQQDITPLIQDIDGGSTVTNLSNNNIVPLIDPQTRLWIGATSGNPGAGIPAKLGFGVQPANTAAGATINSMTVQVLDVYGTICGTDTSSVTIAIATGPNGAVLSGTLTRSAIAGVATFPGLTITKTGTYTLVAAEAGLTSASSTSFTITPAVLHHLTVTQQPSNVVAGASIAPSIKVEVRDTYSNLVSTDTSTVVASISSGPGTLVGTTNAVAVGGVATFSALSISLASTNILAFAASGATGTVSTAFTVIAGTASKLAISQQPANTTASQPITPAIHVDVQDQYGNLCTTNTSSVMASINTGSGILSGTLVVAAVAGIAAFSNLGIDTNGAHTLHFVDGSLTTVNSNSFTIAGQASGTPAKLGFTSQPANAVAGASIASFTVSVLDASSAVVTTDTSNVTLAIFVGPTGAALAGTVTRAAVAGVATFNNISITASGVYQIQATDGVLTAANSSAFTISATTANKLAFAQQPINGVAGVALSPSVTVQVQDTYGNLVTTDTSSVTVAINTGPSGSSLGGTLVQSAVAGLATFNDLALTLSGSYTLTATDGALTASTSTSFPIVAAAAAALAFVQQPSNANVAVVMTPGPQVAVRDAFGNLVTGYSTSIILSILSGPPSSVLTGGSAVPTTGVAIFPNVKLNTPGAYAIRATSGALSEGDSTAFVVNSATVKKKLI